HRACWPGRVLWVETARGLTSVRWYQAVMGRMSAAERDAYWAEGRFFAGELGVPGDLFPRTYADLERYEAEMLSTVVIPDSVARTVARDVLRPYPWLPEALYWPTDALSAALLPIPLRGAFGLRYGLPQRLFYRAVSVALGALRGVLRC